MYAEVVLNLCQCVLRFLSSHLTDLVMKLEAVCLPITLLVAKVGFTLNFRRRFQFLLSKFINNGDIFFDGHEFLLVCFLQSPFTTR